MSDLGSSFTDKTFEERRRQQPTAHDVVVSTAQYYSVIVIGILVGYGVMSLTALALGGWTPESTFGIIAVFLGVLACMIGGAAIVLHTGWLPSTLAYLGLIAAPFGVLMGMFVEEVGTETLFAAVGIVVAMTVILGVIGLSIRTDLSRTGFAKVITVLLWIFVIMSFVTLKLQVHSDGFSIALASVGILLFACLVVLDFNRAKHLPKTLDNAVDSSMLIFLSTLNMLLRVWTILSKLRK
jgi:FtsH-binding integral membrane protein